MKMYFTIHKNDVGTEAYRNEYVESLQKEYRKVMDELCLLRRKVEHGCANFQCEQCDD